MLSKINRHSRAEFSAVFSRPAKRSHLPDYSLYYSSSPTFKASVVVGKKVEKLAVDRNRLRREIYAQLQNHYLSHPALVGSYIFIIKLPYAKKTKAQRQLMIKEMLSQIVS